MVKSVKAELPLAGFGVAPEPAGFSGLVWEGVTMPKPYPEKFRDDVVQVRRMLDAAQEPSDQRHTTGAPS